VNFIGHATVALWTRTSPEFVLGSMLPDFAGMAGTRLARTGTPAADDALVDGIALHHRTDDAFHAAAPFVTLLQETLDELTSLGVPRGAARAVAHIGTEMLIDGELLRAPEIGEAYASALAVERPLDALFVDPAGGARWTRLRDRLRTYGVPHDYRDPDSVLRRLQVVLQSRPRLALDETSAPRVRANLPALQRKVVIALPLLLQSVREALSTTRLAPTD
jgi:acyl carrier protein phosphodiesterase